MSTPNKPILDYACGKPTAAQRRKRWLMIGGLTGGSIVAAAVTLVLAQPKPVTAPSMIAGSIELPVTQPAVPLPGSMPPATQPAK